MAKGRQRRHGIHISTSTKVLALPWEFLGLQCQHWNGYKRIKDGKLVCCICGTIKSVRERYFLLTANGTKTLGERTKPSSKKIFASKIKAQVGHDRVLFHGASVEVDVHIVRSRRRFDRFHQEPQGSSARDNLRRRRTSSKTACRNFCARLKIPLEHGKIVEFGVTGSQTAGPKSALNNRQRIKNCPSDIAYSRNRTALARLLERVRIHHVGRLSV